ncbi:hypothetical protein C4D60_Mb01t08320 [Musa balbisiana]|uniref:BEACH domain-containing protein n=1 Tax=Musa balbisiana TaxID=52838 RepID=A0A4S8JL11_MUSBA|nr:hypothetical protein C4D60_Mb01t08320 [Musa balbisiana]
MYQPVSDGMGDVSIDMVETLAVLADTVKACITVGYGMVRTVITRMLIRVNLDGIPVTRVLPPSMPGTGLVSTDTHWILASSLQHYILCAFRKVLVSAPALLEIFREEKIWELIFSAKFFYFGSSLEEFKMGRGTFSSGVLIDPEISYRPENPNDLTKPAEVDVLQVEAISFLEFVAGLNGNKNNLPECSVLLETLEKSACNPEIAKNGRSLVLHNSSCIDSLFDLFWEENLRKRVLEQILGLLKLPPSSAEGNRAKSQLCSKFLETFTQAKEREKAFAELSIELLIGMRELILIDQMYYQTLFHSGECFLHILSLLNGSLDESIGEQLVLNILQTLTLLLMGNDNLKVSFRALVGVGYQTLQSLLLDFCKWQPNIALLHALLDMLVDGNFDMEENIVIKNEDVIMLFLNVLQKSSNSLQHYGLDILQNMLKDSIINRTACFKAGVLGFLLDWFREEDREDMISKIAELIQIIGGHSISGKDIRKIFALLRREKRESIQKHRSLLLTSIRYMLKEKGPEAFFEFSGCDSGIVVKSPVQWPNNKGFSFSCWLRLEDIPENGIMGLFSFFTDTGKGCLAMVAKDMLIFESINQKRQCVLLPLNLLPRKWQFLCITHSIGRAFSGGSQLRCYVDGNLISSEKCRYAKVSEVMSRCTIGTELKPTNEEPYPFNFGKIYPFLGQLGPLYVFSDALSSEQIKGLYCLGPSYMYSFLGDGVLLDSQNSLYGGILDAKDGLSSKVIFGLNAQASDGRILFNVSSMLENSDKNTFEAFDRSELDNGQLDYASIGSIMSDKLAAEVIELIASILDGNASNQQQMHLLSGFSILGFLLQSVPPTQLNLETLSALKYMFYVLRNTGMSETLIRDAILPIYLNPHIWVFASYEVQRDIYMFLIQYFESDRSLLPALCGLPRIIDMICHFYWDKAGRSAIGNKPLLHPITKEVIGERPCLEDVRKIRLLLLSLAEMSLRELEPIRLLGLQFLGKLLVGLPSEKKGMKFFSLSVGRSKYISENFRKGGTMPEPIFSAMSERLFKFPLSDHLCATLFDVLLGGASPKQEYGWTSWLETSVRLDVFKNYETESKSKADSSNFDELILVKNLYCVVLSHCLFSVKGGWQQLEETINFLLLNLEQEELSHSRFLRDIYEDLIGSLVEISLEENIFTSQPCRDNTLYLLKLINELVIIESGDKLLLPILGISSDYSSDGLQPDNQKDINFAVSELLNLEGDQLPRVSWNFKSIAVEDDKANDGWWDLYDKTWILIGALNGKGPSKMPIKASNMGGPSFGQRARGLVESLNIPAAEMAAVVVSGGITNALGGKTNKYIDKAMLLRGEKCPRVIFHLVILYLCKADLESASRCVQQFISLLPLLLTSDDDQSKNRLHFYIWSLVTMRSKYGMLDDGARFHVITHLILEIVNFGKFMLATSILGRDDPVEAVDEAKSVKSVNADRLKQLQDLRVKLDEHSLALVNQQKTFDDDIQSNVNAVLSSDDNRKASFQLAFDEEQQIVADKWIHMYRALIDERGPWSSHPFPNAIITHWKLDKTEDSWRRRPKLKRNYKFDERLCHPPTAKISNGASQPANESFTGLGTSFPEQMKQFLLKGVRGITEEKSLETCDDDLARLNDSGPNNSSENQIIEYIKDHSSEVDIVPDKKEPSSGSVESDLSEVHLSIPSVLITPKRKLAGHLAIVHNVLHFAGEFIVEGTGGSSVFKSFRDTGNSDSNKYEQPGSIPKQKWNKGPTLDNNRGKGTPTDSEDVDASLQHKTNKIKLHRRWNLSVIKAVHWTRYLLQYTAIEIFFNDSTAPVFLNFASQKDAKHVGTLVVSLRNETLYPKGSSRDKNGIISFVDRRIALEMAENARESWRRREISNFEYLMILNTLAGRSYNDLTQYPVFPWVLADYSSEKLDFNKSSTFRDLSKPVGALDSKRFEVFEDRYRNFCDPDIPSFYYGSHYSSMGIVLYYLLRLEPFTALHRNLQGGKFDHADRLFQSIDGTYRNCLSNTSDVKELIPEFFYMPEFLVNLNSYHLGVKQDGEPLGDVALPPWAKGSPEEFIYRNREALESEYVSSNLHHWIDLVFGYKQRGKPAMEAANIFYYLTYEGAVDLENMDDMLQKSSIEDQIANFGQSPIQIFPSPPSAIVFIGLLDSNIVLVNQGLTLSVKLWLTTQLQTGGNFTFSGSQEPFFGIGSDVLPPRKLGTPLAENIEFGRQCLATMQVLNENYLISCGNWENSFQVISLNDGKIVQSIRQHKDVVSCVAVSSDGSILATGSYDTTVMVWHAYRGRFTERRSRTLQTDFPRKDHVIIESPFHILCGHDDIITCLFISAELDIVISGSKDGTCIFHTLREGTYVRSIQHPFGSPLSKLVVSPHGRLVVYAESDLSLHMYSINGKHVASSESNGRLNCIELSSSGDFLVCAGDQGQIILRSMHSLDVVKKYEGVGKIITSLAVTPEECFLAGTKDGSLLVYSIENPLIRRGSSLSRNNKSKNSVTG